MSTHAIEQGPASPPGSARVLAWCADQLERYSQVALRIARIAVIAGASIALIALAGNIFTRQVLGFSLFGAHELASYAFLWTIWMGVSLAVKRGAVTVITFVSHRGPWWWQVSVRTFSGVSLAVLLAYCCWRSTEFATGTGAPGGLTPALKISYFYPIASMTLGYYFITLHYLQATVAGAARAAERGATALRDIVVGAVGALAIASVVWLIMWTLIQNGVSALIAVAVMFIALTLAGTPIVFMLSIVGIAAMFSPSFLGLEIYPTPSPITPFSTTQFNMGMSGGTELLVILMFLIVAEIMNGSGMSARLISFAASLVAHLRGGMAYVCQLTSMAVSGISGSAQADAAIMTPLLVPAMEREGYRRDVAAAVVAGASIKGPIGPISIMFIVYGVVVQGAASASISKLLLSGVMAELLLFLFQALTVYVVVRRMDLVPRRKFAGMATVARTGVTALPVLAIPLIILGGIFTGVFTPSESGSIAAVVTIALALFWYAGMSPRQLPAMVVLAGIETGIVMLLLGDSSIIAKALNNDGFGHAVQDFLTGMTDNKFVFLAVVNVILLFIGVFIEPLPALYIVAPFLAPVAVMEFGIDPVHFGLIVVFNLVLGLIHPPIGLVLFLVSSIAKVSIERLSIMIIPWFMVSLFVLVLVTYLPSSVVLVLSNLLH